MFSGGREVFCCFQGVGKGCIGNEWVKVSQSSMKSNYINPFLKYWGKHGKCGQVTNNLEPII